MYWAFFGTARSSAFSTARTEAMACTVVQTPQKRWVMAQASRGSRPSRICSTPRHMVPEAQASVTLPPSTSQSIRRWPSMRVIGSMTMRLPMGSPVVSGAGRGGGVPDLGQHRQDPDGDDEREDLEGDQADGDDELAHRQIGR